MASNPQPPAGGNPAPPPAGGNQVESINLMSKVPLGAIIAGPLTAAVEAQAAAAVACANFIKAVGMDKDGKLNQVSFSFSHQPPGAAGSPAPAAQDVTLSVPLLSLLPIPFLRIESLTANFKIAISAIDERSNEQKNSTDIGGNLDAAFGWGPAKVGATGSISSKKDSTATNTSKYSVEQTMDISLHAVQDDMPVGLARLLELLKDEIQLVPKPA